MSLVETDPKRFFCDIHLLESELIQFHVIPSEKQLDIVVLYTAELLSAYFEFLKAGGSANEFRTERLDFRWFRFANIDRVCITRGVDRDPELVPVTSAAEYWHALEESLHSKRRLVTGFNCYARDCGWQCVICFDSFGEFRWDFGRLLVRQRVARVIDLGEGEYQYREARTGMLMDKADPFRGEMD